MKIALFPLPIVLMPSVKVPLHIFEPRYREMFALLLESGDEFGIVYVGRDGVSEIGCTAEIREVIKDYGDGRLDIMVEGLSRFTLEEILHERSFDEAHINLLEEADESDPPLEALYARCLLVFEQYLELGGAGSRAYLLQDLDPRTGSYLLGALPDFPLPTKQGLLELTDTGDRLNRVRALLLDKVAMGKVIKHLDAGQIDQRTDLN